ncbi:MULTISPECIES: hypothetical protein [Winogradskyella]|uniref:hypothetical protein n=1 Tax=Winogradskyella TaxID=286104 RepID=UPI000C8DF5CE|nr:hypothetical protein [Winogradskyella sp. MH6]MAB49088.1 hypothetical protein [Flavobacteriaceae bacterium]|tara:strand:+ start:1025 stop:1522 length:498 start_codon:yes stop_codon:yes gene_type:complete
MKKIAFFLLFLTLSCGNKTGIISGDEYAIFTTVYDDESYFELSHTEVREIENIIEKDIKTLKYYRELKADYLGLKGRKRLEHNTYVRQYFAHYDDNMNKIVEISFMCNPTNKPKEIGNWKKDIIGNVLDGGSCYPFIRVNLSTRKPVSSDTELINKFISKNIFDY